MSDSQIEVYEKIVEYIKEHGYSPTIREICELTGRNSPATILYHLKNLKKLGYINYDATKSRTITIGKGLK